MKSRASLRATAQTALANAHRKLDERLARWLMAHDRIEGDDLPIIHEFLVMLGVRRPGVTEALHVLEA